MMLPALTGWAPIRLYWEAAEPKVDWCYLGNRRFTEPFFSETIENALRLPFNLAFRRQTSVDVLLEWQAQQPGVRPSGFICHMSRCGSTLLAQMLAALPRNIVLSEAGPIDGVVGVHRRNSTVTDSQRCAWLRAMISALGQPRNGETHLFIKLDSWHLLDLPMIRQAFPDVPWIFLYRDPVEVLASQIRQRGSQTIPGAIDPGFLGTDIAGAVRMSPEEYCARLLGCLCEAALDHCGDGGRLVHYRDLPAAAWSEIASYFAMPCGKAEIEAMRDKARFDAKTPGTFFADDRAQKQSAVTEMIRQMAATWLDPVYARLEAVRLAQNTASPS
jgi:hypothetical protein